MVALQEADDMHFDQDTTKEGAIALVTKYAQSKEFTITTSDFERPWGGFVVIDEAHLPAFISAYFDNDPRLLSDLAEGKKMSPKLLLVAPTQRLSWQYHDRRAEEWHVILGPVGVYKSPTNDMPDTPITLVEGENISLEQGERHRLAGQETWGLVAEIWRHTDPTNPSNEADNYRLQDDTGRT